jgi:hypothetical protein
MSFSPKDRDTFFLGDLDAYLDNETQPAFYMRAEKPITPAAEYVEFLDGIPQNLVRKDLIRFGLAQSIIILEWTAVIMRLARGGVIDNGDPVYDYLFFGEDYVDPPVHRWRMVGELRNFKAVEFVILVGKTTEMGEIPTGGTDYNEIPAVIEAIRDTTVPDPQRNLAYFRFER